MPSKKQKSIPKDSWYAQLIIAWPIWAGGYPDLTDLVSLMDRHKIRIKDRIDRIVKNLIGSDYSVDTIEVHSNGYVRIEGLSPKYPRENSVELDVVITGPGKADFYSVFHNVVNIISTEIKSFLEKNVTESWKGANIFDVTCSREPKVTAALERQAIKSNSDENKFEAPSSFQSAFIAAFWKSKFRNIIILILAFLLALFSLWVSLPDSVKENIFNKLIFKANNTDIDKKTIIR